MKNRENRSIRNAVITDSPSGRDGGAGFFCDHCKLEIMIGEDYLDIGEEFICWRCANRMRKTAGEE